jgi:hypothetical protein
MSERFVRESGSASWAQTAATGMSAQIIATQILVMIDQGAAWLPTSIVRRPANRLLKFIAGSSTAY